MDQNVMARALKAVLGEGYESQSRASVAPSSHSPSPHDFLSGRVSKAGPTGGDLHVPTSLGEDKAKRPRGKLRAVEYVGKAARSPEEKARRLETESKVSQKLLVAGATGGVLSLPALAAHTKDKLAQAKAPEAVRATGKLRLLKNPKVGAGLAAGAASLELAGLGGDFLGHHAIKEQRKAKTGILKALAATPAEEVITFSKVDDEKRQVFGWCSISKKDGVDVVDLQGDHIPIDEIEKSAYSYMLTSRKGGNQHARITKNFGMAELASGDEPVHVGDCIESMVFTPEKIEKMGLPADFPQGWWFGLQITDDETWGQIKRKERAGFSIHGKGRREEMAVSKAMTKSQYDRKEKIKDISLGVAGATAAGSGASAALVPLAARRGLMDSVRAERLSGRLKTVGAIVGGTAGVYGGLHAAHQAARTPAIRALPRTAKAKVEEKVGLKKPVRKAWSPTVQHPSPEAKRQRRGAAYQAGAVAGAGAATGGAVHQLAQGRKALAGQVGPTTVKMHQGNAQARIIDNASRGIQAEVNQHQGKMARAKPAQRGGFVAGHNKRVAGLRAGAVKQREDALFKIEQGAKMHNLRRVESAAAHSRKAGKLGLLGGGLAGAAAVIGHKRKGSWRPYSGVQ